MTGTRSSVGQVDADRIAVSRTDMSVRELAAFVARLADALGWRTRRLIPTRVTAGRPIELVLVRRTRHVLAVLATDMREVTLDQQALVSAWGHDGHVWTPKTLDAARQVLA